MASIYTVQQLVDLIHAEARCGDDTEWDVVIQGLIEETLIDAVIRDKPREYLKTQVDLTLAATEIILPNDFLIPQKLSYTSGTFTWELYDDTKPVCPALVQGKPAAFKLAEDKATGILSRLILIPAWISGDSLSLDYYYFPNILTTSDPLPYNRAIPTIRLNVLQRLQIMMNKPADQIAAVVQSYVMAAKKDLTSSDDQPSTNTQQ